MNTPARLVRCAAFLAVAGGATSALAQDSYDGPVVGVNLSEGPRWGPGAAPAETVGGAGLFGGWRWENVRLGLFGQTSWWQGSHGVVLDVGGFVTWDFASLWLDPQLSAATFLRFEPAVRWASDASLWALAPSAVVGGRVAGVELGIAVTPEYWLSELPTNTAKAGIGAEFRLGCDFVDLAHFIEQWNEKNTPPTP
jgi:hypothetical protein